MSDSKAKVHQIRFRLGLALDAAGGAYSAAPEPLAGFKGHTSKWRQGRVGGAREPGEESGGEGKGGRRGDLLQGRMGDRRPWYFVFAERPTDVYYVKSQPCSISVDSLRRRNSESSAAATDRRSLYSKTP